MATLVTPPEKAEKIEKQAPPMPEEKAERRPRARVDEKFKIFSGTANDVLADEVCTFLGMPRGQAQWSSASPTARCTFRFRRTYAAADVFVIQPTCRPVDENLMELLADDRCV